MKSASDSARPAKAPKWSRKKTLARRTDFRPIEAEDLAHVWAAYKKGALASMGDDFADGALSALDFKAAFEAEIIRRYDAAWILFAETTLGFRQIGMVLGFWPQPDTEKAPFMLVGDIVWFPWASPRNRLAGAVHFFNAMRDTIPMMDMGVLPKDRHFFDVLCQHGVMARIGTSQIVYRDQPAAIYETRRRTTS